MIKVSTDKDSGFRISREQADKIRLFDVLDRAFGWVITTTRLEKGPFSELLRVPYRLAKMI